MEAYIGELAALGTSVCFSIGSTLFTLASRQVGGQLVNRTRLLLALGFMLLLHWLTFGQPLPTQAGASNWWWLGLSGLVGLALGDAALFQGFVLVGARLSMLMMALAPALSVILAWLFLGEVLGLRELGGIALTIGGIMVVVSERQDNGRTTPDAELEAHDRQRHLQGLLFALGGAAGQAGGLVLAKLGLANDFPALSGNLIRLTAATAATWLFTAFRGEILSGFRAVAAHRRALGLMTIAAIAAPVTGVWLSLVAVQRAPVGVASTLMSLTPILLLPVSHFVFHEKISRQAIFGTAIAFVGVAVLFLDIA